MRGLLVIAVLVAVAGVFSASEATLGAVLMGLACFLGILARIAQAGDQHKERTAIAAPSKPEAA